jgi:hypothetical protein
MNDHGHENEIRGVLGQGIGEEPPISGGPSAVFSGARSRAVRTRALTGTLSVAAVLGVAAGAVALSGGSGNAGPAVSAAAGGPAVSTHAANAQTAAQPGQALAPGSTSPLGPGMDAIDGRTTVEILKLALPGTGLTTADYNGQDSDPGMAAMTYGAMAADDGTGRLTQVSANVQQWSSEKRQPQDCAGLQAAGSGISQCQAVPQKDGSILITYRQDQYAAGTNGPTAGSYENVAERLFPDGLRIVVGATNYFDPLNDPHEKGWHVNPSRPVALLSPAQVGVMAMDPRWAAAVPDTLVQQAQRDIKPYLDLSTQKRGQY